MAKLTNAVREDIAKRAAMDLFVPALLKQFESIVEDIFALVKDQFKDFDFEHVGPYKEYIQWEDSIYIYGLPGKWNIHNDEFRRKCGLPEIRWLQLPFEIPTKGGSVYLDSSYEKKVEEILHPYMVQYFTAQKSYEDIRQMLLSVGTFRQLEDTLPELVKYLPYGAIGETTALVPIELINRVKKLFQQKQGEING